MTPGSREWVARSLRDWALAIGQGMALVTYRSISTAYEVVGTVTRAPEEGGLTCSTIRCNARTEPQPFIRDVAANRSDVLFVFDVDRMLFGDDESLSPFWINFHRETIVAHPGAQIWWMSPKGAIRFGQSLPDLARFFLFRESLAEEAKETSQPIDSIELRAPETAPSGNESRAEDLFTRALEASKAGRADSLRIWLELAFPAMRDFLTLRRPERAISLLKAVSAVAGPPVDALKTADAGEYADDVQQSRIAGGLSTLSLVAREMGQPDEALVWAQQSTAIYRKLAEQRPEAFLPDLATSLNNLANNLSSLGMREKGDGARGGSSTDSAGASGEMAGGISACPGVVFEQCFAVSQRLGNVGGGAGPG